jgi:hypothetical protein
MVEQPSTVFTVDTAQALLVPVGYLSSGGRGLKLGSGSIPPRFTFPGFPAQSTVGLFSGSKCRSLDAFIKYEGVLLGIPSQEVMYQL